MRTSSLRAAVVLLLGLGLTACNSAPPPPAAPPASVGNTIEYTISRTEKQKTADTTLVLTLLAREGGFTLGVGPDKTPGVALGDDLKPADGVPIAESDLGLLFLPPNQRREGTQTLAGRVEFAKHWERWDVWQVQLSSQAMTGQRYYERRTGFLVGYELTPESDRVKGQVFLRAILSKTDLPGLL